MKKPPITRVAIPLALFFVSLLASHLAQAQFASGFSRAPVITKGYTSIWHDGPRVYPTSGDAARASVGALARHGYPLYRSFSLGNYWEPDPISWHANISFYFCDFTVDFQHPSGYCRFVLPHSTVISGTSHIASKICAPGYVLTLEGTCAQPYKAKNLGSSKTCLSNEPNPCVGNPIDIATGNKFQLETDYIGSGLFPVVIARSYNSLAEPTDLEMARGWRHSYQRHIVVHSSESVFVAMVAVHRQDGKANYYYFPESLATLPRNTFTPLQPHDPDVTEVLEVSVNATDDYVLRLTNSDDELETYDSTGKLLAIADRNGLTQQLAYDAAGLLLSVTDHAGNQFTFNYDSGDLSEIVDTKAAVSFKYTYDAARNLTSVTYPDAKTRRYLYENTTFKNALTGIVDENGNRFATWAYADSKGRATLSEHAGGAERVRLRYTGEGTIVLEASSPGSEYKFKKIWDTLRITSTSQRFACCSTVFARYTRDGAGFVTSKTDYNGNVTAYSYGARGLEVSRIEAYGTALARTVTTSWHPRFRLPLEIVEPNRLTTFSYDAKGNLSQKTITSGQLSRTSVYAYNALGLVTRIDGPRTDVADVTSFNYDAQGNLTTVTNALGHLTQITAYNSHGQPLTIIDPNGLVTQLTYDMRGRLISRLRGDELTQFEYDGVGQLISVTSPDASVLRYGYDAAHRLTSIRDGLGNQIVYTLDAKGNRFYEVRRDPANVLTQQRQRVFNVLSCLTKEIGGKGQTRAFSYDANGNLTSVTDPLAHTTTHNYDALNRLTQITDPAGGTSRYSFDANDQLTSVTDPRNLTTAYDYDGLGNLASNLSPDSGNTANTYDAAGNLTSKTDARGLTTRYSYDSLNRLTRTLLADRSSVVYQYDNGTNAIGRLVSMKDVSGTTRWGYDAQGRVIDKQQKVTRQPEVLRYSYNNVGQLASVTYPSGNSWDYVYTQGQVTSVVLNKKYPLLSNIQYQPFGPVSG